MAAAVSRSLWSAAQRNAVRRFANSTVNHANASRCRGLFHSASSSVSQPAKYLACALRARSASPLAISCSSANCRIVSSIENRVRSADLSATNSDLRTNASSRSKTANSSLEPLTAHAPARSNPPANTEHLASTSFSASPSRSNDHCTAWRRVWWRSSPRRDPTNNRNRSSSRSQTRRRSWTAFARRPTRSPTGSRRGDDRSR